MQGRARSFNRMRKLLVDTVPFPTVLNQTGDPVPRSDKLGSNGGEVMPKAMTVADKGVGRPTGPVIGRVKDSSQRSPLSILKNAREPLVLLTTFTRRLEVVLELRGLHVFGPASNLSDEDFV